MKRRCVKVDEDDNKIDVFFHSMCTVLKNTSSDKWLSLFLS